MKMPIKALAIVSTLASAIALSACSGTDAAKMPSEVMLGVALPTTGGSATLGEPMTRGIEMAVNKINKAGGILGVPMKTNQVDLGSDANDALNAFNRLVSDNPAAVIGFPVSTQGFAVMTQVDRAQIPVVMGGTNSGLAAASDWAFSMTSRDAITSTAAVKFAAEKLGVKKIALLRESGELGKGASEVVNKAAKDFGVQIVDEEIFQTGDVDLATQANKIKASGAGMLMIYGQQADYIVVSNALATAGVKLPSFIAGLQPGTYDKLNYKGFAEIYNRNQCIPAAATEGPLFEWSNAYKAQYGTAPTEYAAIAYDGTMLIAEAIKKAGTTDHEAVRKALTNLSQSEGICGMHVGTPEGNLSFGVTIGHYVDGKYKPDQVLTIKP